MGAETFSEFLLPIKFKLDEHEKKKFDAVIAETEKRFKEIGTAATAAAAALFFAVREISKNLSSLAYAAERVGASSEELKALGNAADRVGIGAEAAKSSLSAFFAFVNFEGGASAIKQWFNTGDFDPMHPLKVFLDSAVKLSDEYAKGGVARQTAIVEGRRAGYNDALITTPGAARRLRDEMEKDEAFTGGKLNPIAEKAKRLNAEFEKVKQHLEDISQLVSGSLMDAFSDLLDEADGWLKAHKEDIKWFSDQAADLAKNILDVTKGEFKLLARLEANTSELMRIQDIINNIREALKWLGEGSIASKINAALEWAFQPFKWLWDKLQSLGLVGPAVASTGGAATGSLGGGGGGETSLAGRAVVGQSGGRSHLLGGGAEGKGGATANTPAAMAAAEAQLRAEGVSEANVHAAAALLVGQAMAESGLDPTKVHDNRTGYGIYGARLERRTAMFEWLSSHGFSKDSLEGQMKYMAHEAMTSNAYAATRRALMNATAGSIDRDTRTITPNFEAPKIDNSGVRVGYVRSAFGKKVPPAIGHLPATDFHKRLDEIRSAKPLTPWQQSLNEHHDHRSVHSNVKVEVAGTYPIGKTAHPLERTKNATLIRNTTATAS